MPKRIQCRRVKGWRMPENCVSATRPGKWGNPFVVGGFYKKGDFSGYKGVFRMTYVRCLLDVPPSEFTKIETAEEALEWFRWYLVTTKTDCSELRGKDLACWCAEGQPCHADILIELANAPESGDSDNGD